MAPATRPPERPIHHSPSPDADRSGLPSPQRWPQHLSLLVLSCVKMKLTGGKIETRRHRREHVQLSSSGLGSKFQENAHYSSRSSRSIHTCRHSSVMPDLLLPYHQSCVETHGRHQVESVWPCLSKYAL